MKIAILGASGFIGKHIFNCFKSKNFDVVTFGRNSNSDFFLDLNNYESIKLAINNCKPNVLIHIASPSVQGIYRNSNKLKSDWAEEIMSSEIIGSSILFNEAKNAGIEKIIYLSSASVYGKNVKKQFFSEDMSPNPNTLYGAIKLSVEQIGMALFPNLISLRLFQVFGEGDLPTRLVPYILNSKESQQINLTPCTQISDLIYVSDVADCVFEITNSEIYRGVFNLGSGIPMKLNEAVMLILNVKKSQIIPNFNAKEFSGYEVMYSCANMTKLFNSIAWRPKYDFLKGIKELINN
jgi:nucleoside-diphosphate-sugar epimerase